jgi:hypothetical protein
LRILDITDPTAPNEIAALDTDGYSYNAHVVGNLAFVADGENGLRIVDLSKMPQVKEVGSFMPPRERVDVREVEVRGAYAYVAAGYSGVSVVDISDPSQPHEVAHHATPRSATDITLSGDYAFVGDSRWLRVIDVSIPSSPKEVAAYQSPASTGSIWATDSRAYVAAYEAGLMIFGLIRPDEMAVDEMGSE